MIQLKAPMNSFKVCLCHTIISRTHEPPCAYEYEILKNISRSIISFGAHNCVKHSRNYAWGSRNFHYITRALVRVLQFQLEILSYCRVRWRFAYWSNKSHQREHLYAPRESKTKVIDFQPRNIFTTIYARFSNVTGSFFGWTSSWTWKMLKNVSLVLPSHINQSRKQQQKYIIDIFDVLTSHPFRFRARKMFRIVSWDAKRLAEKVDICMRASYWWWNGSRKARTSSSTTFRLELKWKTSLSNLKAGEIIINLKLAKMKQRVISISNKVLSVSRTWIHKQ